MRIHKRAATVLSALVAFSGFALTTAPTAGAATYGCNGSQIGAYAVKTSGGTTFGTAYLYYDSSTGKNCAAAVKNSTGGYGNSTYTSVSIEKCAQTSPASLCTLLNPRVYDDDGDNYLYYAGPVSISAPNNCIHLSAVIWNGNGSFAQFNSGAFHCS
ncbi:hypothetical protein ACIGMX_14675 [Streptomyces aquilus]|uniref:hypothetical protein n=1 Tax=Streptomyces aquilus TaxID=2548456 RepID=UPI0037CFC78F